MLHRTKAPCYQIVVWLAIMAHAIMAANWAQMSGTTLQNTAIVQFTPWTPRFGNSAGIIYHDPVKDPLHPSKVFMVGGDDFSELIGGGGLRNDVWYYEGAKYSTVENLLKFNFRGDPYAEIVSTINWIQSSDKLPPAGVTYNEWISCTIEAINSDADIGGKRFRPFTPCNETRSAEWGDQRFSPRRHHVVLGFNDAVYVMGGRAMPYEDIPGGWEGIHGGIVTPRVRWREELILKNDIWKSKNGEDWVLVNPGCNVPQLDIMIDQGDTTASCKIDADCYGDSTCHFIAGYPRGTCVCNMWQGRESFTAVVYNNLMWVFGGMTFIEVNKCGEFSCGGGYRQFMNDVWYSADGVTWNQVHPDITNGRPVPHWRGRGEHAVVVMQDSLYLFGGRTGDIGDQGNNPFLNDFWTSTDGRNWKLITPDSKWEPRGNFIAGAYDDEIVIAFGENSTTPLDDAWSVKADSLTHWVQDFDWVETDQKYYVDLQRPIKYLLTLADEEIAAWQYYGVFTIQQMYDAEWWIYEDLPVRFNVTRACQHYLWAERIVNYCTVQPKHYDTDATVNVTVVRGGRGAPPVVTPVYTSDTIHPCYYLDSTAKAAMDAKVAANPSAFYLPPMNVTCAQVPSRRAAGAYAQVDAKLYILGGRDENGYGTNDCWYRKSKIPQAAFKLKPKDQTSDTVFIFDSDEEWAIYEYQLVTFPTFNPVIRNWTRVLKQVNYIDWLWSGEYEMTVRAMDPAGNVDLTFVRYQNLYIWIYVKAPPWVLIICLILLFLGICFGIYLEWRRRKRKAALERYAQKRQRRKFKKQAREAGGTGADWKKYRDDAIAKEMQKIEEANMDPKLKKRRDRKLGKDEAPDKKERAKDKKTKGKRTEEKKKREEKKTERREKRKKERKSKNKAPK